MHVTAQKALGIAAMGQGFQGAQQRLVERPAGHGIVDRLAVDLGGARHIVVGLGPALDLQRVHAHLHQALDMLHRAQVLGVHDVGAVLVLVGGHLLAGAAGILEQEQLIGRRAGAQGRFDEAHYLAQLVLLRRFGLVLPAAGVGATALVGVALVDVAGQ
ncbi:hypothetical protein D9M68_892410 [compost metagenome]